MAEQFTGYVKIKDGNKGPLDYSPNREVEVSISFSTDARADLEAITMHAANVADGVVNDKLARTTETVKPARKTKPPTAAPAVEQKPAKADADPAGMGEPTVVPASGQAISTGDERKDPASVGEDIFTSAPAPVTDTHLMSAITRRNAETTNALAIRTLIGKYVPQDGKHHQAHEIEQDKRQAFLTELDKVQKPV